MLIFYQSSNMVQAQNQKGITAIQDIISGITLIFFSVCDICKKYLNASQK